VIGMDREAGQFIVVLFAGGIAAVATAILGDLKYTTLVLGCLAFACASFLIVRRWGYRE